MLYLIESQNTALSCINSNLNFVYFVGGGIVRIFYKTKHVAQMAERVATNSEVPSLSPHLGSNETCFNKNDYIVKLVHVIKYLVRNLREWS